MANYILVHGGDRDGAIWKDVARLLEGQGHCVYCPSMRSVKISSLSDNVNEIIDVICSNYVNDIILCGHSYGAMVITGVFNKVPEKIARLVFVDSVVPESGKSLFGMLADRGTHYQDFGLTADRACLDELSFDETSFLSIGKVYIHSLRSEFLAAVKPIYESVSSSSSNEHWISFCLDATHGCMFTHSRELAVILSGIQVLPDI